jgi:hypothetical protein
VIYSKDLSSLLFGRSEGLLVILAVYADDSSDAGQRDLFTVGGFIGFPDDFFEAERRWEARLKIAGIDYFRASECQMLTGQFHPSRLMMDPKAARTFAEIVRHDLGKIISKERLGGITLSLDMRDFRQVLIDNPESKEYFYSEDPYIYMFVRFIIDCIHCLDSELPGLSAIPVAFVLDDHSRWKEAEDAYRTLRENPSFENRLASISHSDDKKTIPLQMADLCAYEGRHQTMNKLLGLEPRVEFTRMAEKGVFYRFAILKKQELLNELMLAKQDDEKRREAK